jgi:hypothetical protein
LKPACAQQALTTPGQGRCVGRWRARTDRGRQLGEAACKTLVAWGRKVSRNPHDAPLRPERALRCRQPLVVHYHAEVQVLANVIDITMELQMNVYELLTADRRLAAETIIASPERSDLQARIESIAFSRSCDALPRAQALLLLAELSPSGLLPKLLTCTHRTEEHELVVDAALRAAEELVLRERPFERGLEHEQLLQPPAHIESNAILIAWCRCLVALDTDRALDIAAALTRRHRASSLDIVQVLEWSSNPHAIRALRDIEEDASREVRESAALARQRWDTRRLRNEVDLCLAEQRIVDTATLHELLKLHQYSAIAKLLRASLLTAPQREQLRGALCCVTESKTQRRLLRDIWSLLEG